MSNLAQRLIRAGFLNEAEDICNRAIKVKDYHKNVGTAIARIKDAPEAEGKKLEELLKKAAPLSEFFKAYGQALAKQDVRTYKGRWKGPVCELSIMVEGGSFLALGGYESKMSGLIGSLLLVPSGTPPKVVKYVVKYEGTISGRAIKAVRTMTREDSEASTLLGEADKGTSVLMYIVDNFQGIRVLEKSASKESKFYNLTLIEQ